MLRCAAKNFRWVTVVVDPEDYPRVIADMRMNECQTTLALRWKLASKVFAVKKYYDTAIEAYLDKMRNTPNSAVELALEHI